MANNKDFVVNGPVSVGKDIKVTVGSTTSGSVASNDPSSWASYGDFSVASQDNTPTGVYIKPDGTKMYVVGSQNDTVFQYSLSTAWDVTTASYDSVSKSISAQETIPYAIFLKDDGTSMYIIGQSSDAISQYTLSTAWDVSTASYSQQKSVSAQGSEPRGLYFKSDGLRVFTADAATNSVFSYTLSTAWDISTASYDSKSLVTTSDGEGNPGGIVFNQDGTFLYVVGDGARAILQYQLTTAYDLSTATITSSSYAFNQNIGGIHIKPDNTKVYLVDYSQDVVTQITSTFKTEELDLSTGNYFNHTLTENTEFPLANAGDVQAFQLEVTGGAVGYAISSAVQDTTLNVAAQGLNPTGIAFKPDGTKMYVCNYGDDEIQEWNLSTAWDISTATYDSRLLITTNASNSRGLFISPDGINVYVGDAQTLALVQYTLSTAWDISTGGYTRNKAVSSLGSSVAPENVFFKPDGTKLYLVTAGDAWQSTLSTAWDISTATYDSIVATAPRIAIFIPNDGLNLFSWTNDIIQRYPLSTAWDLSTIGSSAESFDLELTNTSCKGIAFKPDGTKMYFVHSGTDLAYQYSTASSYTLTWPTSIKWPNGAAPSAPSGGETDVFTFTTDDSGTTYTGIKSIDNAS